MNIIKLKSGNAIYYFDQELIDSVGDFFHRAEENLLASLERGKASIIEHQGNRLVYKHYHRGGLVAHLSRDHYLWLGEDKVRAFQELSLLEQLKKIGLPAPIPVAARAIKNGLSYQCDLVTREIQDCLPLSNLLSKNELTSGDWQRIGRCIRQFHDQNIYHADLNASNILLGQGGKIFLVDFDKGEVRQDSDVWKQTVLARLRRSLIKLSRKKNKFHYTEDNWLSLINAYIDHKS